MRKTLIAPSILSADFSKMGEEVNSLALAKADLIHCDVMDGVFVKNITFGPKMLADIRKGTTLPLDAHLMIVEPIRYVERFASAGADIITVHYEACGKELRNTLLEIKKLGVKCGAVLNPDSPVSAIRDVIELCDMVLLMSVFPGFGGQSFIPEVMDKIKELDRLILSTGKEIDLEIDGGVNLGNIAEIRAAGANVIVAGNTVFSAPDRAAVIEKLRG